MSFWQGRRVFITGHTGLRGSWLAKTLHESKAIVFGYALPPATHPSFFETSEVAQTVNSTFADIRELNSLKSSLEFSQAEVVFHLAGGGGLKESWDQASDIYSSQVLGTVNLLETLRETATVRAVVVMSADKIYRTGKNVSFFSEEAPLAGGHPAATAKACTELILESYLRGIFSPEKYQKHKIALASARMGAVLAGGDFSADSFIFQLAKAAQEGVDLRLRHPGSVRPWMSVEDAIQALLCLGQGLLEKGPKLTGAWNFGVGPQGMATVDDIKKVFIKAYAEKKSSLAVMPGMDLQSALELKADMEKMSLPEFGTSILGRSHHSGLDSRKAYLELGWQARHSPAQAAVRAAHWYAQEHLK